jgi:hypothetical protein
MIVWLSLFIGYGLLRAFTVTISLCVVNYWMSIPILLAFVGLYCIYTYATKTLIET